MICGDFIRNGLCQCLLSGHLNKCQSQQSRKSIDLSLGCGVCSCCMTEVFISHLRDSWYCRHFGDQSQVLRYHACHIWKINTNKSKTISNAFLTIDLSQTGTTIQLSCNQETKQMNSQMSKLPQTEYLFNMTGCRCYRKYHSIAMAMGC